MTISIVLKKLLLGRAFATEKGRIKLFEKMDWTLIPSRALAKNFQALGEKRGKDYLYNLGYEAGITSMEEIIRHLNLESKDSKARQDALLEMLEFTGLGKVKFILLKIKENGHHHITFQVKNNTVIEHAAKLFGTKSMVCSWFMGVYAAHLEEGLGLKNPKPKENKCICRGSLYCEFESKW